MEINIGKIVNVVGLKGEVKVYGDFESFNGLDKIYLDDQEYTIENARCQKDMVILKLRGIDDRNMAETLRNREITVHQLRELPKGTFYIRDLVGLEVIDLTTQKAIGKVKDVMTGMAQDIIIIELESGKEVMIPNVKEFVKDISLAEGIKIMPIPGLIDQEYLEVKKDEN